MSDTIQISIKKSWLDYFATISFELLLMASLTAYLAIWYRLELVVEGKMALTPHALAFGLQTNSLEFHHFWIPLVLLFGCSSAFMIRRMDRSLNNFYGYAKTFAWFLVRMYCLVMMCVLLYDLLYLAVDAETVWEGYHKDIAFHGYMLMITGISAACATIMWHTRYGYSFVNPKGNQNNIAAQRKQKRVATKKLKEQVA